MAFAKWILCLLKKCCPLKKLYVYWKMLGVWHQQQLLLWGSFIFITNTPRAGSKVLQVVGPCRLRALVVPSPLAEMGSGLDTADAALCTGVTRAGSAARQTSAAITRGFFTPARYSICRGTLLRGTAGALSSSVLLPGFLAVCLWINTRNHTYPIRG